MTNQIAITLIQIKNHNPPTGMWNPLVKARGKTYPDFDTPFPLSSLLETNSLEEVVWCFRCLPKDVYTLIEYAIFCTELVSWYTEDKRIHKCISMAKRCIRDKGALRDLNSLRDLSHASEYAHSAAVDAEILGNSDEACIATTAAILAHTAVALYDDDYIAVYNKIAAISNNVEALCNPEKQVRYLRKLLNGEF